MKPFIESRLVAVRTNGLETALGHFRSVRPKFVIRKCVRLNVNFAVREYPIAILAVQSPLRLRHPVTFWRGQVSLSPIMPKLNGLKMLKSEH